MSRTSASGNSKSTAGERKRGKLLIIGGAEERQEGERKILRRFVELAGGKTARILVCAVATTEPEESLKLYEDAFGEIGVKDITLAPMQDREHVELPKWREALDRATAVFMTGGDQLRVTTIMAGTDFYSRLKERQDEGLVIGGTSAGAAAMSSTMIIGGEGTTVRRSDVQLAPGLDLMSEAVIDTHFNREGRVHRLMTVFAHNPATLALGLDEDTAMVVTPGEGFEVLGSGVVTVFDGRVAHTNAAEAGNEEPLALIGVSVHVLPEGYGLELPSKQARVPEGESGEE